MSGIAPVYLDSAATTRPLPTVVDAMARAHLDAFGNPSSPHSFGPPAKKLLTDAREFLRGTLGAAKIVFTSGGSEADYLGIAGSAVARAPGRILMAASDHPALLRTDQTTARWRHRTTVLPVTRDGDLAPETLFEALGKDVRTVALMHGHNELGTLSRLEELVEMTRREAPEAHIHIDLVQTYGKVPFCMDEFGVDSVAVSGHKFHGPRGAGFLALSSTAQVRPLQLAGGQEEGLRGGTENVAGAVGLACAAEAALSHQAATAQHTEQLAELLFDKLATAVPDAERLGHAERRLPHILSVRLPGITGQTLLERCDERGVAFSTGSACHNHDDVEAPVNHVLAAIGLGRREAREVIRLSFSSETTRQAAEYAALVLAEEAARLAEFAPRKFGEGITGESGQGANES